MKVLLEAAYHCGFNFIIEALSKEGVPVLAKWQCINGLTKALMQSMEGIFGELELEFVLMRKVEVVKYGGVRDTESQHEHVRQLDIGGDYGAVFVGWKCQLSQYDVGGSCVLGCLEITIERMGNDKLDCPLAQEMSMADANDLGKECHKRTYISSFVPRLQEYSVETAIAVIADQGATLKVDTQHLRELSFRIGSIFQFIGELNIQPNNEAILQARTGRNVDGIDLDLYYQSLQQLRQFQAKHMKNATT
ncbi:hypothetical protein GOBAR_AA21230 [Gossypium barbadense]|uniref:Uncharacterized protein n=1 Tax=Gossypium barbadense TaxID=3634 RepID=A0A2P5X7Y0_GOSBA|nr:hypothetical protein GOBAR_AA21230 [Gossypium barbadense]